MSVTILVRIWREDSFNKSGKFIKKIISCIFFENITILKAWKEVPWISPLYICFWLLYYTLQHTPLLPFLLSRHSVQTKVSSDNYVIVFPSDKILGVVNICKGAGGKYSSGQWGGSLGLSFLPSMELLAHHNIFLEDF